MFYYEKNIFAFFIKYNTINIDDKHICYKCLYML